MSDPLVRVIVTRATLAIRSGGSAGGGGSGGAPSGPAGGDLAGTYPNPTVGALPTSRITGLDAALAAINATLLNAPRYSRQTADFTDTSGVLADTAMQFTPAANSTYLVEWFLAFTSAISTTGCHYTLTGPASGATLQTQAQRVGTASSTELLRYQAFDTVIPGGASQGAVPTGAFGWAIVVTGAAPSGPVKLQARTEVAASLMTILAGSHMRYTLIP